MNLKNVIIKPGILEKLLLNRHPWIFSGAVDRTPQAPEPGEIVRVTDQKGDNFGYATFNPNSDIRLRMITWNTSAVPDDDWFANRIKSLAHTKEKMLALDNLPEENKNYRVVFSDADSIPGLIIDRYGLVFVIQSHTYFAEIKKDTWINIIKKLWKPAAIYERSDIDVRKKEGLITLPKGLLYGELPEPLVINEDGFRIIVDVTEGQKTGYFLDLRQVRRKLEHYCRIFGSKSVLNLFGYTGSINLYAARAGADTLIHVESSRKANDISIRNAELNGIDDRLEVIEGDCFDYLEDTKNEKVDVIVVDPPSFVRTQSKTRNASSGYERLNSLALRKLKPGGLIFSLCCSSFMTEEIYRILLFKSSSRFSSQLKVIDRLGHDSDHLWPLTFPEARYFQAWILLKEY